MKTTATMATTTATMTKFEIYLQTSIIGLPDPPKIELKVLLSHQWNMYLDFHSHLVQITELAWFV